MLFPCSGARERALATSLAEWGKDGGSKVRESQVLHHDGEMAIGTVGRSTYSVSNYLEIEQWKKENAVVRYVCYSMITISAD